MSIAFVAVRCAPDTLRLVQDETTRVRFQRRYKAMRGELRSLSS